MGYQLFDINGNELTHHDVQDKLHWCKDGERIEEAFVKLYGENLWLSINPEKYNNPYAPDLLNTMTGQLGDLKFQSTPFFKAWELYKIDPTYTVVFNLEDKNRYEKSYPNLKIYYWIDWIATKFKMGDKEIIVKPLKGVWVADFPVFREYLESCPIHIYQQRVHDANGNAKSSYVCKITDPIFEKLI